jgi:hypothetical protein
MICTFSTSFPSYHPRAGEPTDFIRKILAGEKIHTIRAGHRWKDGDMMDFRHWSDKPYRSPMVKFWQPLPIRTQSIVIELYNHYLKIRIDNKKRPVVRKLAINDGLSMGICGIANPDFLDWFSHGKKEWEFEGQILHWTGLKY